MQQLVHPVKLPTGETATAFHLAEQVISKAGQHHAARYVRAADDAILAFCDDFRQRHGVRPTAVELYHSGYNPRSLRRTHGSWAKFLRSMDDLTEQESSAVDAAGDFLEALESTPMTKSFKMLTLTAMLNQNALPGRMGMGELTTEFRRLARRSNTLRADVGAALEHDAQLRSLIENQPIAAWCGGRGTGGHAYFQYNGAELSTDIPVPAGAREDFQNLVRELVEWRLAEYLDRGESAVASDRFVCRVLHAGGRPILKLPDRRKNPGIPSGWVEVLANDQLHVANFAKEFVNVLRTDRESEANVLGGIIRGWFGVNAGRPGTRYEVVFEPAGDALRMRPVVIQQAK